MEINRTKKKPLLLAAAAVLALSLAVFARYAPAIFQEGNPLPVWQGILKLERSSDAMVPISGSPGKFIAKAKGAQEAMIRYLNASGWVFQEQMGAGYVFVRQGELRTVVGRQYSRHYRLWTIPDGMGDLPQ